MLYTILRALCVLLLKLIFRIDVRGQEYIPKTGGVILAANHISYLDPIAVGVACRRKLNYMGKEELFCGSLISSFMSSLGVFPVKRDSPDLSALKEAMKRVKKGGALVLFPEGSRRFDTGTGEPYPGIGFLVAKLNVPVIPTFIKGTQIALPKGARFIKPTKISVHFGREILIERRMPYQDIAGLVMENIRHLSC